MNCMATAVLGVLGLSVAISSTGTVWDVLKTNDEGLERVGRCITKERGGEHHLKVADILHAKGRVSSGYQYQILLDLEETTCKVEEVAEDNIEDCKLLIDGAKPLQVNPLFLTLPATISCSYAFMLPAATPPNAIVFACGKMNTWDMAKPGIIMNLICCVVQFAMINTLGVAMFDLYTFPEWANTTQAMHHS